MLFRSKIVKNLNQQAKVLGYKDYSELSYVRMNRICLLYTSIPLLHGLGCRREPSAVFARK